MKTLAEKTDIAVIIIFEFVAGLLIILGGVVVLPLAVFLSFDYLLQEPLMWMILGVVALACLLGGYFMLVRPFLIYRKLPRVLAETDGEYLYIHSLKKAKIPLAEMEGAGIYAFPENLLVQVIAGGYGPVVVDLGRGGKYKLYFVNQSNKVPEIILPYIENAIN